MYSDDEEEKIGSLDVQNHSKKKNSTPEYNISQSPSLSKQSQNDFLLKQNLLQKRSIEPMQQDGQYGNILSEEAKVSSPNSYNNNGIMDIEHEMYYNGGVAGITGRGQSEIKLGKKYAEQEKLSNQCQWLTGQCDVLYKLRKTQSTKLKMIFFSTSTI